MGQPCVVSRIVLDWETARADDYVVQQLRRDAGDRSGASADVGDWVDVPTKRTSRDRSAKHVVDTLELSPNAQRSTASEYRVLIHKPATNWGVSLWRFELWGMCAP